jgi:secreted trypsin-like serine protease
MGNGCGEAALPGVWMRVSRFRDFITDPHPTLAPGPRARSR